MKKFLPLIALAALLASCIGCTEIRKPAEVPYREFPADTTQSYQLMQADWQVYESTEELTDAATEVFSGELTGISFVMLNLETGKAYTPGDDKAHCVLHTVYTVKVSQVYKGQPGDTREFCIIGGIAGVRERAQHEVIDACGATDPSAGIPVLVPNRELEIGESYLFCTVQMGGDYDQIVNISQFVYYATSDTAAQIQKQCAARGK